MKSYLSTVVVALAAMGAFSPSANAAINWTISPDGNAIANSVTVVDGIAQFGSADTTQPQGIYGAGFTTSGTNFQMQFDSDLNTWDSYNAPGSTPYSGYWDAFIVTVSTSDFYWNLPHTDPVTADASTFVWGGTNFGDGILESYICAPGCTDNISLSSGSPSTFYVSLVLDTKTLPNSDTNHPSWGSFHVSVVPEPETYAMLLAGLGLVGFSARRRMNNNGTMNNA